MKRTHEECHHCGTPVDITGRHWRVHLDPAGQPIRYGSLPDEDSGQIGTFALGENCGQVLLDLGVSPVEQECWMDMGDWPPPSCRRQYRYARKVEL